jgi:hypothetical protein
MLQTFNAINGQSLLDVCLNTYGTTDLLYKLLQDNTIPNLNSTPVTGQQFVYDDSLVIDQGVNQYFNLTNTKYATDINTTNYATQGDFNSDFNVDFSVQ